MAALGMNERARLAAREGGEGVKDTKRPDAPRGVLARARAGRDAPRRARCKGVPPPPFGARTATEAVGVGAPTLAATGSAAPEKAPAPNGAEAREMATSSGMEANVRPILDDGVGRRAGPVRRAGGMVGADIDRNPMADQDHEGA